MGNSSSSEEKKKVSYDVGNCNDNNMGDGCEEIMEGNNIDSIKKCKIVCLNSWINKLEEQRDSLKENIVNLEKKLKRISESTDKAIANTGF